MEPLLQDIRHSIRAMIKSPGFAIAAVVSLALGVGPNTMIFSLVNALLLKSLPVNRPEQLLRVFRVDEHGPYHSISYPDYLDYRDRQQVFTELAACQRMMMSLSDNGRPEAVAGAVVSANFFSVLGVQPLLGRAFAPEEDRSFGEHPVAIISYNLWQRQFNADPAQVGRTMKLNGHNFTVIGVSAPGFTGVDTVLTTEVWVPIKMLPTLMPNRASSFDPVQGREEAWLNDVIGRLKPGVSLEQAQSSLSAISVQIESVHPSRWLNQRRGISLAQVSKGHPEMRMAVVSFTGFLMVVVGIVLLITCANVANLLLTRASARQREIAIRLALGAGRWRLVRQLLAESVLLALAGGIIGVLLAYWANTLLLAFKPSVSIPITIDLSLDYRVLGFSLLVSLLTGIVFGLVPALQTSRPNLVPALKSEQVSSRRRYQGSRFHSFFVIAQMALSLVLLIGAALLFRSMQNAYRVNPGFEKTGRLLLSVDLDLGGYTASEGQQFYRQLMDRVQSLPGLRSASLTTLFPLSFSSAEDAIVIEGRESQPGGLMVGLTHVSPRYFETMGIPLVQGREFSPHDTETGPKVVIINQTMARRFWPDESPLGKRIKFDRWDPQRPSYEVVGIAKDSQFRTLGESPRPFIYLCLRQEYSSSVTLVAHTERDAGEMLATLRHEIEGMNANLPVFDVKTVTEHLGVSLVPLRIATALLGLLGILALSLASVGLYSVVSYSVTLQRRDLGIRMALGAKSVQVLQLVLRRGTILALIGATAGLGLGLVLAYALSSLGLLYGISALDPTTFLGASGFLVLVALLASYLPARRAAKIDPAVTLRQE
jgi:putative ABC transport system permease protein